jgi:hypothetical protein
LRPLQYPSILSLPISRVHLSSFRNDRSFLYPLFETVVKDGNNRILISLLRQHVRQYNSWLSPQNWTLPYSKQTKVVDHQIELTHVSHLDLHRFVAQSLINFIAHSVQQRKQW